MSFKANCSKGFTLVELLVVIIIIGILAGMLMLAAGTATDRAEATKIVNALRNYKSAAVVYYAEHGIWPSSGPHLIGSSWMNSLDRLVDRSLDNSQFVGITIEDLGDRVMIGLLASYPFVSSSAFGRSGVRRKLVEQAKTSALYSTGGGYFAGNPIDIAIYTNLR